MAHFFVSDTAADDAWAIWRKRRNRVSAAALLLATWISPAALAGSDPQLEKLAISEGSWVYHGREFAAAGARPTNFVWHADCRWSANRAFMMCSFANSWGGRHIDSLVVDTFNHHDHAFWHYEIFEDGDTPEKPFAARMQVDGPVRTEEWTETDHGKAVRQRIVYRFVSDRKVSVSFQQSQDGKLWKTTASGTGEKTGS